MNELGRPRSPRRRGQRVFTLLRPSVEEMQRIGATLASKVNAARGPVRVVLPLRGMSIAGLPGGSMHDPEGDRGGSPAPVCPRHAHANRVHARCRRSRLSVVRVLAVVSVAASLAALACAPREGTPGAAYRSFVRAVADRDADRAWSLLSSDTQAWLEARAGTAATAAPGVIPPSARQLLLGTAARSARPLTSVVVSRESRDRAILEVEEEGGTRRQVELVREEGWRVRIPAPTS